MLSRSELTTLDQGDAEVQLTARLQEGISKTHANLQLLQRDLSGRLCLKMGLVLDRTRFITSWQGTVTAFCESIVLGNYTITERNCLILCLANWYCYRLVLSKYIINVSPLSNFPFSKDKLVKVR